MLTAVAARTLGPAEFGRYSLFVTTVSTLAGLCWAPGQSSAPRVSFSVRTHPAGRLPSSLALGQPLSVPMCSLRLSQRRLSSTPGGSPSEATALVAAVSCGVSMVTLETACLRDVERTGLLGTTWWRGGPEVRVCDCPAGRGDQGSRKPRRLACGGCAVDWVNAFLANTTFGGAAALIGESSFGVLRYSSALTLVGIGTTGLMLLDRFFIQAYLQVHALSAATRSAMRSQTRVSDSCRLYHDVCPRSLSSSGRSSELASRRCHHCWPSTSGAGRPSLCPLPL